MVNTATGILVVKKNIDSYKGHQKSECVPAVRCSRVSSEVYNKKLFFMNEFLCF